VHNFSAAIFFFIWLSKTCTLPSSGLKHNEIIIFHTFVAQAVAKKQGFKINFKEALIGGAGI